MMDTKVIEKIQKLFALANNNPSEEEAASAALMAQRLMAKHNISATDIDAVLTQDEKIVVERYDCGAGKAWKFTLSSIIAQNFRCKTFSYGKRLIAFYGYETDAAAAKQTFEFLFKMGHRLADREVHRKFAATGRTAGVYNSFCLGFLAGIKEKLDAQCTALMIVIAPKVTEEYETYSSNFKERSSKSLIQSDFDRSAYETGMTEGRAAMGRRELEC